MTYRVGATPAPELYSYWEPQTPINMWVRIFPLSDGTLKPWDHEQFDYCRRHNAIPFLSTKIDGDATKLAALRQRLIDMPTWITVLYITDRHEPEGDLPVDQYKANFNLFADMIEGLPAATRAKVLYGHILTRAWTENTAGRTYATHDTGRGDFFGVDMYAKYWSGSDAATSYPDPATFLSRVKAYRYNSSDNRPRVFPEMGAPNLPFDSDGTARAAWIQGVSDQLDTWSQADLGFRFDGWIWWNFDWTGNATGGLGTLIPYRLDHKVIGTGTSADPYRYAMLPGTATPPRLGWCPGSLSVGNTFKTYPGTQAVRIFVGPTEPLPSWTGSDLGPIVSAGAVPHVSFKNFDLTALVNWLNAMPAGVRLILTYHHEPEQQNGGDPTASTFRSRWLQLVQKLASHPARSRITLAVVFTHYYWENWQRDGKPDPMTFWPADAAYGIDAVGWDVYNESSSSYRDPNNMLQLCRDFSAQVGKPYLIGEWGAERITGDTSGAGCVAWMRAFVDVLRVDGALTGTWYHYGGDDLIANNRTAERDALADLIATKNAENPSTPLSTFNSIASAHYTTAEPPPPDQPPPPTEPTPTDPTPPPPDEPPPPSSLPVTGPAAARLLRADYTILITDANCQVLGDPLDGWTSLQVTKRWKEPGSGQIVIPAYRYVREQLQPGCRIVVLRSVLGRQKILISGPMESKLRERADDGDKGGVGVLTVTFTEDLAWLGARLAYPNPALALENQTTDYWVYTGNPEQGMLQLVDSQAGPNALEARRVPRLVVAPFSGISGTGTVKLGPTSDVNPRERLEKLTDVLRRIATLGNGAGQPVDSLGFRTRQVGDQILFEPVRSRDLAGEVHFSFGMGNLKYYSFDEGAPKLNVAAVGGQAAADEGAARFVREFTTTDQQQLAWGRFEGYIARPGTDPLADMQAAANEGFQEGGQTGRLAVSAADTVDQRYGIHYDEGDLVSIELDIGEYVTAPVQTISIQAYPTAGEVVGTTIGDQSARYDSKWIKRMREMDRRLGYLERRALTR